MLDQRVLRRHHGRARLDRARGGGLARGGRLDELERLRGHDDGTRCRAGTVPAAAGALQQPRHALRAADLQHLIDRSEVDTQIEARRTDHRAQPLVAQPVLDPVAHVALERPVVQRDRAGPIGPRLQDRLVPDFGLRADVGEDERRFRALDRADHLRQQLESDVTRPWKPLDSARTQAVDHDLLRIESLDDGCALDRGGTDEAGERGVEVGECCRQPPDAQSRIETAQPGKRQLGLHAALGPHQLVPLVDDDRPELGEPQPPVGAGEEQRQALRRGDERRRQPPVLARARGRSRVARPDVDRPVRGKSGGGPRESEPRVPGQRTQRRDPEEGERRGLARRAPTGPKSMGGNAAA